MRKHNGMRPQDIIILLKIISIHNKKTSENDVIRWQLSELSSSLHISISEISESLNRSQIANLVDREAKKIKRQNLMEFLEYGVKYVFPQRPGTMVRGFPTAHSHSYMKSLFLSDIDYVWPDEKGNIIGLEIEPFHPKQVYAVQHDTTLYKLLILVDMIRVGKTREVNFAIKELKKEILNESSNKFN